MPLAFSELTERRKPESESGTKVSTAHRAEARWANGERGEPRSPANFVLGGQPLSSKLGRTEMILTPFGGLEIDHGEFDPGSERTLAARLKHASRAARGSNPP
jgi:hypothetical protein